MEYNQTYIVVLIDTLKKKVVMLNDLLDMTNFQNKLLEEKKVETEEFDGLFVSKQEVIDNLNKADEGFELIYDRVKEELEKNAALYRSEIVTLKNLISEITEKSVALQTAERRNYNAMELYFSSRKKTIRDAKMSQKTVGNYYKSMSGQLSGESYYLDKRK